MYNKMCRDKLLQKLDFQAGRISPRQCFLDITVAASGSKEYRLYPNNGDIGPEIVVKWYVHPAWNGIVGAASPTLAYLCPVVSKTNEWI